MARAIGENGAQRWLGARARGIAYVAIALFAALPVWLVKYPPMMDVPFHLSTIRVIHDFHDPAFGFDHDYVLTLGRTQYILYYLLGSALAYVVGVVHANAILMSAYLAGTVLGVRALLRALGNDERACLFAVPLVYNVMFLFGLFPFLFGLPLMFVAIAFAVRLRESQAVGRELAVAALGLALFYCHVVPFGVFAIAYAALFPWRAPRRWPRALAPLLPSLAALVWWARATAAGRLTSSTMNDVQHDPHKRVDQALAALPDYLVDIFRDRTDDAIAIALALTVVAAIALSWRAWRSSRRADGAQGPTLAWSAARAYAAVPIACVVLYFVLPDDHGYIAIIAPRFAILAVLTALPLVRIPRARAGAAVTVAAAALAVAAPINVAVHFRAFAREVGDFDGALAAMQPRKRVAALIFDRESDITRLAPYLHFGSYYALDKGGVVKFSYVGYAHWPIDFLSGHAPPPGGPARLYWEWQPEKVTADELSPYFDYVLARGDAPAGDAALEAFSLLYRSGSWSVWQRQ